MTDLSPSGARPPRGARPTLDDVTQADADDPLASFRDRFVIRDDPAAYLDGNSLGRTPRATVDRLAHLIDVEWATRLIRSWDERWLDLPHEVGDRLGAAVLGAATGQTVIADSTTVNLYKTIHAAVGLRPGRDEIVIDEADFPTDRYVVNAVAAALGLEVRLVPPGPDGGVSADQLRPFLGERTAAVVLSHVDYRSGYLADMATLTAMTHDAGGVVVWDLSHSAGAVPVRLDDAGVDLAVGCTYKYLNAGPGAPAYIYVADRHHADVEQPIPGWFGAEDVFAMARSHRPAHGVRRMLSGTPNVPGIVAVDEGVKVVADAGIGRIRAKSIELVDLATDLADSLLAPLGWQVVSPRRPAIRGSHIVVRGSDAEAVTEQLIAAGVVPDFRQPDLIRIGLAPLTTTYREVWDALHVMRHVIATA